ncbi:MAG: hypothetical protein JNL84_00130 [Candidatus Accumulibacter sp.]|nr:hypothetical protein [Accumulibacter sp.]
MGGQRCDGWMAKASNTSTQFNKEFASIHFFPFLLDPKTGSGLATREDFRFSHFPDDHFDLSDGRIVGLNRGDQYVTGVKDTYTNLVTDLQASTFQNMARKA